MAVRLLPLPFAAAALFLVASFGAAQPEKDKDPADDPLPKGAPVRYGISRPILRLNPSVGLIPPKYTNFLAPTMTGGIRRYDLSTGRPLDKRGIVTPGQVTVSADGKRAVCALPGAITVLDVATGKLILGVRPPDGVVISGIPGVALSADGKILAYGGKGQDLRGEAVVMDVDKNEVLAQCETMAFVPIFVTLSRDGKTLATYGPPVPAPTLAPKAKPALPEAVDNNRTTQIWEVASGRELFKARCTGMGGHVVHAAFSPDADMLAISCGDGPVDVFEVKNGKRLHTLLGRKSQGARVAIAPDGQTIASVGMDYRIQRWQADGTPIGITDAPAGLLVAPITNLEFANNEQVIATMTAAQFAYAWDAPAGKLLSPQMDHAAAILSIAFPEGGKDLYSSSIEGKAFRWDLGSGTLNEEIAFRPARIPGQPLLRPVVHLSADGTRGVWPRGALAEVFDVNDGDNLYVLPPPSSPPAQVNFSISPDGMRVAAIAKPAVGKRTGMCVVWDVLSQKRVAEMETPNVVPGSSILGVFSPDNSRLVLAAFSNTPGGGRVLVYVTHDLKTGRKLATIEDPAAAGTVSLAIANDTTMIAASSNGRLWTVDYVNGKIGDDIENLIAAKGEPPYHGPIAVSPDGKRFATGIVGEPYTTYGVRLYDLALRRPTHTFIGHAGPVSALRFSPEGHTLASGAQDTSVILWDVGNLGKLRPKEKEKEKDK
jgi:WD40 repeat protein